MANTLNLRKIDDWINDEQLPKLWPGKKFKSCQVKLKWGGLFKFNAVSDDGKVVICISTSSSKTAKGKSATSKYQKIMTDALFLLNVEGEVEIAMVFTEKDMKLHFDKAVSQGRFPPNIKLLFIELGHDLQTIVVETRKAASIETSP